MASPTEAMRKAWAAYEGNEGAMRRISFGPDSIKVAPPTVDAWKALERVLEFYGYDIRIEDTDSYNDRAIKGGGGKSLHAYGIALDVNWHTNPYRDHGGKRAERFSPKATQAERAEDVRLGLADTDMTKGMTDAVLAIKTVGGKRVLGWGGAWDTLKDAMHFQIEVTPTELAQGIDWATVPDRAPADDRPREQASEIYPSYPADYADSSYGNWPTEGGMTALREGDSGPMVTALQESLKALNYQVGAVDGDFGSLTRDALLSFQANNNLPLTGTADQQTLAALPRGRPRMLSVERMTTTEADLQEKGSRVINASGWNRWLGIGTAILGAFGLTDRQTSFVTDLTTKLTGAPAAEGAQASGDLLPSIGGIVSPIISLAGNLLGSGGIGPWGIMIGLGYFILRNANSAAAARVAEHRAGANLDK